MFSVKAYSTALFLSFELNTLVVPRSSRLSLICYRLLLWRIRPKEYNFTQSKITHKFFALNSRSEIAPSFFFLYSCWSYVGRRGGKQVLSLQRQGCVYHSTVQHELLHALGFNHEQTRSDRDNHIRVQWENISNGWLSLFLCIIIWIICTSIILLLFFLLRHEAQLWQNQHAESGNFLWLQLCHAISQVCTV